MPIRTTISAAPLRIVLVSLALLSSTLSSTHSSTHGSDVQSVSAQTVVAPVTAPPLTSADSRRLEDAVVAAMRGDGIIESFGEQGTSMGLVALVHRKPRNATHVPSVDGEDEFTLLTLATQIAQGPWYRLSTCIRAGDADVLSVIDGSAAGDECRTALRPDFPPPDPLTVHHGEPKDINTLSAKDLKTPSVRDLKTLSPALLQARGLVATCRRFVDGDVSMRAQCETLLNELPELPRAQCLRTPAQLLVWVEVMDAKQCALRLLKGWRASEQVSDEVRHALKSFGAEALAAIASQHYLKLDGSFGSLCADECYSARAWELVQVLSDRNSARQAALSVLEQDLSAAIAGASATCGIDAKTTAQLLEDLELYTQALSAAVPSTLRMTPTLSHHIATHVRDALCAASEETNRSTLIIRCRNELLNEVWAVYGKLLHESDLLSDFERTQRQAQVDAVADHGAEKIEALVQRTLLASGERASKEFSAGIAIQLARYRALIKAPFDNPWATWNVFPFSEASLAAAREKMSWHDPRPGDFEGDDTTEQMLFLKMVTSGQAGINGLATLASMGAGMEVLGMADQGIGQRGVSLQPFPSGGSSMGGGTPAPWIPRMWARRR